MPSLNTLPVEFRGEIFRHVLVVRTALSLYAARSYYCPLDRTIQPQLM
jgi:hypothetical protein